VRINYIRKGFVKGFAHLFGEENEIYEDLEMDIKAVLIYEHREGPGTEFL
jgi:hypothetical protein